MANDLMCAIEALKTAGLRPSEALAGRVIRHGDAAIAPLLELASDTAVLRDPAPQRYAPIHALRLLGEIATVELIAPLLLHYRAAMGDNQVAIDWQREVWYTVARPGAAALPLLEAFFDDAANPIDGRLGALIGVSYAPAASPEVRGAAAAWLRERLAASDDRLITGHLCAALANMAASEAYGDVMARFRAGEVDTEVINAGTARQFLLGSAKERLAFALLPLWERYEQHGPFPDEALDMELYDEE